MATVSIPVIERVEFGKGAARRLRREGQVPAVIHNHGAPVIHICVPSRELLRALRNKGVVFEFTLEGKVTLARPVQIQRDPLKDIVEHIDLLIVSRSEAVEIAEAAEVAAEAAEVAAEEEAAHLLELSERAEFTAAAEAEADGEAAPSE